MEEFELVLQSRYLNQSRISARCVEWDTEEEIWGITQAFKELTTYSKKKKKNLRKQIMWQTTTCYILWGTVTRENNSKKERRWNPYRR